MSVFTLSLRLRIRYLFYGLVTIFAYFIISTLFLGGGSDAYIPGIGFLTNSKGQTIGLAIGCIVTLLLQCSVGSAMKFFTENKIGKGRAARVLFRHRDVVNIDTSWKSQWESTKKYSFYADVIPINLYGLGALICIGRYLADGFSFLLIFFAIGFFLLAQLFSHYANEHLCNPEMGELYEPPQTYDHAISSAKQELMERAATQRAKDLLEKERKRNSPLPPKSSKQKRPPHKPY